MRHRRYLQRALLILFVPFGLACLGGPFLMLFARDGSGMIDDTRAWFGAGTAEGVPEVSQVSCFSERFGSSTSASRGVGMTSWNCTLYLVPAEAEADDDYWKTMPYDEAMKEYRRRIAERMASLANGERLPGSIERVLATNREGDLPVLRRLSGEGEPLRFGAVWSGWEIAGRWLQWALISALFLGFGCLCLLAARRIWQRTS